MRTIQNTSEERREAIARAARAVVRLAADQAAQEAAKRHDAIVNDGAFSDREAWDSVQALESMVIERGLITPEELDADHQAWKDEHKAGLDAFLAKLWSE